MPGAPNIAAMQPQMSATPQMYPQGYGRGAPMSAYGRGVGAPPNAGYMASRGPMQGVSVPGAGRGTVRFN